jgi:acetylornithine/N-succinyldiaminopimelate aminotransferase
MQALMELADRPPVVFVRGQGSWLWDADGRRYLDFVQGWAVNTFGHSSPVVSDALAAQSKLLVTPGPGFQNAPAAALAERLVRHSAFDRVCLTSTGAEANEAAVKLARKWGSRARGGAHEIITFDHAFHGRTLAMMSASGKPQFKDLFEPKVPGFPKARLNDLSSVERLITERTVGVMLEPVQGEAGVIVAADEFMRELRALTRQRNLLLIVDEIQTGLGRTGKLWAHEHAAIAPDIMTVGKMLGGGVPLSAMLSAERVACFEHGEQGGTFNGNPLMAAVGCAVLDAVTAPGVLEAVVERGRYLCARLEALSERLGLGVVRGRGLLLALELGADIAPGVVSRARAAGLLLNAPRPNLLRLIPALNVSVEECDRMLEILEAVIQPVRNSKPGLIFT